jgi:hypothetical protein
MQLPLAGQGRQASILKTAEEMRSRPLKKSNKVKKIRKEKKNNTANLLP